MALPNYALKSRILKTDLCKKINSIDKATYLNDIDGIIDRELDTKYFDLLLQYGYDNIKEARKINKATYQRYERLKERISNMLSSPCIFITLNFNDKTLEETTQETRKDYVRRYLKQFKTKYIANIDFGSDRVYLDRKGNTRQATSREHYHALIQIDHLNGTWSHGWQYREKVKLGRKSTDIKLGKYISKLTNHAIKETTKRCAIIYSR